MSFGQIGGFVEMRCHCPLASAPDSFACREAGRNEPALPAVGVACEGVSSPACLARLAVSKQLSFAMKGARMPVGVPVFFVVCQSRRESPLPSLVRRPEFDTVTPHAF